MTIEYPTTPAPGAKTITSWNGHQITYSVDSEAPFAINAWNEATPNPGDVPFWHQPHDLTGADWNSQDDAQAFADQWMNDNFANKPAPIAPSAEQVAQAQAILESAGYVVNSPAN